MALLLLLKVVPDTYNAWRLIKQTVLFCTAVIIVVVFLLLRNATICRLKCIFLFFRGGLGAGGVYSCFFFLFFALGVGGLTYIIRRVGCIYFVGTRFCTAVGTRYIHTREEYHEW